MAQSASYIYTSVGTTNWYPPVGTTNWQSDNTAFAGNFVLPPSGISFCSSGTSFGFTISVGSSGTSFGSTNISVGSSGTSFGGPSTGQIFGLISPRYKGIEVERSDILTAGETRMLPELLNPVICYAFVSAVAIRRATQGEQGNDASRRRGRIRIVQVTGGGTAASADLQESPFAENRTTPQGSGGLERALRDLEDFSLDDWDAEGARAISPDVIREAARLLSLLPDGVSEPEVAPANDGSICMEWDSAAGSLWLDIGPDRTAQTLIKIGALKEERRFCVDAPDLAIYLRMASERIYPSKQDLAIRSVMVAA
jgi:hypothetical protein